MKWPDTFFPDQRAGWGRGKLFIWGLIRVITWTNQFAKVSVLDTHIYNTQEFTMKWLDTFFTDQPGWGRGNLFTQAPQSPHLICTNVSFKWPDTFFHDQRAAWGRGNLFIWGPIQCCDVQMFKYSNVQKFKCSNVRCQMSNTKCEMSIRLNFCRSITSGVPPVIFVLGLLNKPMKIPLFLLAD